MLILGRKVGEKVMIGKDIIVSVCGVNGNQIRLGFEAPNEVPIHREEVYLKVQKEDKGKSTE